MVSPDLSQLRTPFRCCIMILSYHHSPETPKHPGKKTASLWVFSPISLRIKKDQKGTTSYLSHLKKSPTGCPGTIQAVAQIQSPIAISAANPAADGFTELLGPRPSGRVESETKSMASKNSERYTHTPNKMQLPQLFTSHSFWLSLKTSQTHLPHPPRCPSWLCPAWVQQGWESTGTAPEAV